jgi:hypothetical protein
MMPKENKFTLRYKGTLSWVDTSGVTHQGYKTADVEPYNWPDFEMAITRQDLVADREITSELEFAHLEIISDARSKGKDLELIFSKRNNDWTYTEIATFTADMTTYREERERIRLSFIENSIRKKLVDNASVKYDIDVPILCSRFVGNKKPIHATHTHPDAYTLLYTGLSRDIENVFAPALVSFDSPSTVVPGVLVKRTATDRLLFADKMGATSLYSGNYTIKYKLGKIVILDHLLRDASTYKMRLNKYIFGTLDSTIKEWGYTNKADYLGDYLYTFEDSAEYSQIINLNVNESLVLEMTHTQSSEVHSYEETRLSFSYITESLYSDYMVYGMTQKQALTALLAKITPCTLVYNIPDTLFLASESCLAQSLEAKLSLTLDDIKKSLRCSGAALSVSGTTVTVDYVDNLFSGTLGGTLVPINNPVFEYSNEHVYGSVRVGYKVNNNAEKSIFCENVFKLSDDKKELDLVSPFKASPYDIEETLDKLRTSSTKKQEYSEDIFIFDINAFDSYNQATLNKDYYLRNGIGGEYNLRLSPMNILLSNERYLLVSGNPVFSSSDGEDGATIKGFVRYSSYTNLTDAITNLTGRALNITVRFLDVSIGQIRYYNYTGATIEDADWLDTDNWTEVAYLKEREVTFTKDPLFYPYSIVFDTSQRLTTLDTTKYYAVVDNFSNKTYNFFINDISLQLTKVESQSWNGICYTLPE